MTEVFSKDDLTDDQFLGGQVALWQPKTGYRAGTDPVLLAAACQARAGDSVLELGCGVGTTLICLNTRIPVEAVGVERNETYAQLARQNAARNGMNAKIFAADLTKLPPEVRDTTFDHVLINPPFFGPGRKANDAGRAGGRQEDTPLADWIDQALKRTKPKGHISLIFLVERLAEVIAAVHPRAGDIEIKPLSARENHPPKRFILRARKGARGPSTLHNPLIMHEGEAHLADFDSFSAAAKAILRDGQPLKF